jgi:hypothetical protein
MIPQNASNKNCDKTHLRPPSPFLGLSHGAYALPAVGSGAIELMGLVKPLRFAQEREGDQRNGYITTERMHDLVIGLFINRYEFGWSICTMVNTCETPSFVARAVFHLAPLSVVSWDQETKHENTMARA